MNISDALQSIIKSHEDDVLTPLTTVWGENLDATCILPEYPRPQLVRASYINLTDSGTIPLPRILLSPTILTGRFWFPFHPKVPYQA